MRKELISDVMQRMLPYLDNAQIETAGTGYGECFAKL